MSPLSITRRVAMFSVAAVVPALLDACTSLKFAAANFPAAFGAYTAHRNVGYGSQDRQQLDVYVPASKSARRPIVMFVHGGGWMNGSKDNYRFVAESLTERGFIAVLPNYRLFPSVRFPVFVDDVATAFAWTKAHAAEFGGDPGQIFLMGHSAGAHIGALLTLDPHYLRAAGADRADIKGFIGLAGPYDFLPFNEDYLRDMFGPESEYPRSQPVNFVTCDARALAPILLIHGEDDQVVWPSNSRSLAKHLRECGALVEERYYPHTTHGDVIAAFAMIFRTRSPILNEVDGFVRREGFGLARSSQATE